MKLQTDPLAQSNKADEEGVLKRITTLRDELPSKLRHSGILLIDCWMRTALLISVCKNLLESSIPKYRRSGVFYVRNAE